MVDLRVVEHSLGRDAADVQARSAERAALLDACGLSGRAVCQFGTVHGGLGSRGCGVRGARTLRPSWAALMAATYPPGPEDPREVSSTARTSVVRSRWRNRGGRQGRSRGGRGKPCWGTIHRIRIGVNGWRVAGRGHGYTESQYTLVSPLTRALAACRRTAAPAETGSRAPPSSLPSQIRAASRQARERA